jgi:hypothetical protein
MIRKKHRRVDGFKLLVLFLVAGFLLALAHKEYSIYRVNQELDDPSAQ